MKSIIKEHWKTILFVLILILIVWHIFSGISSPELEGWYNSPISQIKIGDVLVIVIIHAYINRTEIKK